MYEKITLANGVRIVFERMPVYRSAAAGIWVGTGSRDESPSENGSAHFIEHMLFKGTGSRTASELAEVTDSIGGRINACTSRENTCFYARVLDSHLDTAIDLLCDMFFNSVFAKEDVETERGVILEEISMYEDSPEDSVVELLFSKCFRNAFGRPVLGKPSTLTRMTGTGLKRFMSERYCPECTVFSVCGNFEDRHLHRIEAEFSGLSSGKKRPRDEAIYSPAVATKRKYTEQNHLCVGFPGLTAGDDDRFSLSLLSTVLGGGVSSRLFSTVREKYGLCYSVYTFCSSFSDTGLLGVETALSRETERKALGFIINEIRRIRSEKIKSEELERAREQAKSSVILSLESTSARMERLGFGELLLGHCLSPEEITERYDAVTADDILDIAGKIFDFEKLSFSAVGNVGPSSSYCFADPD